MIIKQDIVEIIKHQLSFFWENREYGGGGVIYEYQEEVIKRLELCFSKINNKYYFEDDENIFSPYHSVQYSIYLYFLANTIHRNNGNKELAAKVYYLNKILHSIDWYYEIQLPDIFSAEHPLGSVMGRAKYSNKFFFYQGCTVGGNKSKYPTLGENVIMYSNSSILGNCKIGNNVIVGANCVIKDESIPDNCLCFGQSPNLCIKEKTKEYIIERTSKIWRD